MPTAARPGARIGRPAELGALGLGDGRIESSIIAGADIRELYPDHLSSQSLLPQAAVANDNVVAIAIVNDCPYREPATSMRR